jgi:WW domain-binding protein 11
MNPTDQARKEQRKKELKKNKKQRQVPPVPPAASLLSLPQVVRVATLKGKNPREIIEELEKIDDMEYNPVTPCPLNAKVDMSMAGNW